MIGALGMSITYAIVFQYMTPMFITVTWYLSVLCTITYVLALWFVIPPTEKFTCGQSLFTIILSVGCICFAVASIAYRQMLPLVTSLHAVMKKVYRALPCIRIGLIVSEVLRTS